MEEGLALLGTYFVVGMGDVGFLSGRGCALEKRFVGNVEFGSVWVALS